MKIITDNNIPLEVPAHLESETQAIVFKILFKKEEKPERKKFVHKDAVNKSLKWTPEDDGLLESAYRAKGDQSRKKFCKIYAGQVGRSKTAIEARLSHNGIALNKHLKTQWTPEKEDELRRMFLSRPIGESITSFSRRFSKEKGSTIKGTSQKIYINKLHLQK